MIETKPSQNPSYPLNSLKGSPLKGRKVEKMSVLFISRPPVPTQRRRPGPRKLIPRVPKGELREDRDPSAAATVQEFQTRMRAEGAPGDAVVLVKNVELSSAADNNAASSTGEPSVASNRDVVFYTGNWYAAMFALYIPQIDTFVWLLQYSANPSNENLQRLAFATTAEIKLGHWRTFDLTPQSFGLSNCMLDFPDLAGSANFLCATTNAFRQDGNWDSTLLARIPYSAIVSGQITADHLASKQNFGFRVAQNCGTQAIWASHQDTSTLRVFTWDETSAQATFRDIPVASWDLDDYSSLTPDQFNWLGRADSRIVGATLAGKEVWFAWGAARGGVNKRPHPYVQIARLSADDFSVIDNINIWHSDNAVCYAALGSNSDGEVGVSYAYGGGQVYPSHAVGILTGAAPRYVATVQGAHGPAEERWGDYLSVRRHEPGRKLFAATGYTLQNGTGRQDGSPRFVLFGLSRDVGAVAPPSPVGPGPAGDRTLTASDLVPLVNGYSISPGGDRRIAVPKASALAAFREITVQGTLLRKQIVTLDLATNQRSANLAGHGGTYATSPDGDIHLCLGTNQGDPHMGCEVQNARSWVAQFNAAIGQEITVTGFFRCLFEHPGFRSNDDAHIFEIHPVRAVSIAGQILAFDVDVPDQASIHGWNTPHSLNDNDDRIRAQYDKPADILNFNSMAISDENYVHVSGVISNIKLNDAVVGPAELTFDSPEIGHTIQGFCLQGTTAFKQLEQLGEGATVNMVALRNIDIPQALNGQYRINLLVIDIQLGGR